MQRNKHHCKLLGPPEEGKESMQRKEMKLSAITYPFLNVDEMINHSMTTSGELSILSADKGAEEWLPLLLAKTPLTYRGNTSRSKISES